MIVFPCHVCRTSLSADAGQAGQLIACPVCKGMLRVPVPEQVGAAVGGGGSKPVLQGPPRVTSARTLVNSSRFSGKQYGFNCGYCSSRLEATESMAAQEGQCPTCGNQITVPILDRYGRLIDPKTRQIIRQDPHPVHAYAAAGVRAPKIIRTTERKQIILCPRCAMASPITANNCKSCGMPFTMEGTTLESSGSHNGFCVASLVLGIIGIPSSPILITPALAIIFGALGLKQVMGEDSEGKTGKGMAIAGIICGLIGAYIAASVYHWL